MLYIYVPDATGELKGSHDQDCQILPCLVDVFGCGEIVLSSVLEFKLDSRCCRSNYQSVFLVNRIF